MQAKLGWPALCVPLCMHSFFPLCHKPTPGDTLAGQGRFSCQRRNGAAASSSTGLCQIANDAPNDDIPTEGNRPMIMPEKQPKVTMLVCAFVGCADPTVQHDSMPLSCIMLNCRYLVLHGTCPHYQVVHIKTIKFFHRLSRQNHVWKLLQGAGVPLPTA